MFIVTALNIYRPWAKVEHLEKIVQRSKIITILIPEIFGPVSDLVLVLVPVPHPHAVTGGRGAPLRVISTSPSFLKVAQGGEPSGDIVTTFALFFTMQLS